VIHEKSPECHLPLGTIELMHYFLQLLKLMKFNMNKFTKNYNLINLLNNDIPNRKT